MRIQLITDRSEIRDLREAWDGLLARSQTRTPELSYDWQMTYWDHFHHDAQLFVLACWQGDGLRGLVPLKLTRSPVLSSAVRTLEFLAAAESNYEDFIIEKGDGEALESIVGYLANHRNEWDLLKLRQMPEESAAARFFIQSPNHGLFTRVVDRVGSVEVRMEGTWEGHLKSLSANTRKQFNQRTRAFRTEGDIESCIYSDQDEVGKYLEVLFEQHRARWNRTTTPSQFNHQSACDFYRAAVASLLPKGHLRLFVLKCGGKPISILCTFAFENEWIAQLITHDTSYEKMSPGLLGNLYFIREGFTQGVRRIDFGDDLPYKRAWTTPGRKRINLEVYSPCLHGATVFLVRLAFTAIRRRLRDIRPLWRLTSQLRKGKAGQ